MPVEKNSRARLVIGEKIKMECEQDLFNVRNAASSFQVDSVATVGPVLELGTE